MDKIFFWSDSNYHWLSNFELVTIVLDGQEWSSVEHYYQAQKFLDINLRNQVRELSTPGKTKRFARKHQDQIRADWPEIKLMVMEKALREKYQQEPFKSKLLATSGSIFEDSPQDNFWGTGTIGQSGPGLNYLGKILEKIRQELQVGRK